MTYDIASLDIPTKFVENYHVSQLKPFEEMKTSFVDLLEKRGRPKTEDTVPVSNILLYGVWRLS